MAKAPDVRALLKKLVGKTIPTATGAPNKIVAVAGPSVAVGTAKSPEGREVAIAEVQNAVDRLFRDGTLEISKESVGYRSAFVGAVIGQIPGVRILTNPRRAVLER